MAEKVGRSAVLNMVGPLMKDLEDKLVIGLLVRDKSGAYMEERGSQQRAVSARCQSCSVVVAALSARGLTR